MLACSSTTRAPDSAAPSRAAAGTIIDTGPASTEPDRIAAFVRAVEAAVAEGRAQRFLSPVHNDLVYAIELP